MEGKHLPILYIDYTIIFHILNFIVIYLIFKYIFFPRIELVLEERKDAIQKDLLNAKSEREEALKLRSQMQLELSDAHKETKRLIDEATQNTKLLSQDILREANEKKEEIIKSGKKNLEVMELKLKEELKNYVMSLAVKIAEKIMSEKISNISEESYNELLKKIEDNL